LKHFAKALLAAVTAATVAAPIPAAPPAGAAAGKAPVHHSATRFRGVPTFANSTLADIGTFDDPTVREAAVEGLGRYNGAVVAVNPNTGRILTVVNQKVAFGDGFIPCSTIKPTIAVAALEENVITRDTMLRVKDRRARYMNLTEALAHSNNDFFEQLGVRMGFNTVSKYARLMGLGELAGYNLPEEHPGSFPMAPPAKGGVARMSSFGEGIQITPFQLVSLASAFANGGTLYYLQYPRTPEDIQNFQPKIKRDLNIAPVLPEIREGMLAAVLYGTAKRSFDAGGDETPLGKTGTCNDPTSKVGWFVTYADEQHPKIALAVLLRGQSHQVEGPTAALVAGRIYKRLREQNYFATATASNNTVKPVTIVGTQVAIDAGN
jgi:cell division protein FtsI/penicillin-binding protein 2